MYSMVAPWRWRNPGAADGAMTAASPEGAPDARLPSSRANGSRECTPDDRLRGSDPVPSLPESWIASSLALLAMTMLSRGVAVICNRPRPNPQLQISRSGSDHALDQIIHLLEFRILLAALGAGRNHRLALVVDQRALEDRKPLRHEGRLDFVGVLARLLADLGAIGRDLDDLFLQATTVEVRNAFAGGDHLEEFRIERFPIPFRAGEVGFGRERREIDVIAADHGAAAGGVFGHRLRAVDVTGEDVDTLVDQAIGSFRFLNRHRPVAGEDHLRGRLRNGELGAKRECVDVAQDLRDRFRRDEAELAALGGIAGDDAGDVLRLVDI